MVVIQFKDIIGTNKELDFVNSINIFSCKDEDVEIFLKSKAFEYEKRSKSRTYLILDDEHLYKNEIIILGYFTLSLKALCFSDNVSKSKIKNIDGFSKDIRLTATILIGQFGKDKNKAQNIHGTDLFLECLEVVYDIHNRVGNRIVLLECINFNKIVNFYMKNGFEILQGSENGKYLQMIKPL